MSLQNFEQVYLEEEKPSLDHIQAFINFREEEDICVVVEAILQDVTHKVSSTTILAGATTIIPLTLKFQEIPTTTTRNVHEDKNKGSISNMWKNKSHCNQVLLKIF